MINLCSSTIGDGPVGSNSEARNLHGIEKAAQTVMIWGQAEDFVDRDSAGDISVVNEEDIDDQPVVRSVRPRIRIRQQPSAAKDKMFLFVKGFGQ